jgi:hypothetical protein
MSHEDLRWRLFDWCFYIALFVLTVVGACLVVP